MLESLRKRDKTGTPNPSHLNTLSQSHLASTGLSVSLSLSFLAPLCFDVHPLLFSSALFLSFSKQGKR